MRPMPPSRRRNLDRPSQTEDKSRRGDRTYSTWYSMIRRCYGRTNRWKFYGGRGIKVCKRWWIYENFLKDMGERPERMTLDRVNVNGHYTKANCRWAGSGLQSENRRPSRRSNKPAAHRGFRYDQKNDRWQAQMSVRGKRYYLATKKGGTLAEIMAIKAAFKAKAMAEDPITWGAITKGPDK